MNTTSMSIGLVVSRGPPIPMPQNDIYCVMDPVYNVGITWNHTCQCEGIALGFQFVSTCKRLYYTSIQNGLKYIANSLSHYYVHTETPNEVDST